MMGPVAMEVIRGMRDLEQDGLDPVTVVFSPVGWRRAAKEVLADGIEPSADATFMGLKRMIHARAKAEVVVTHLEPLAYAEKAREERLYPGRQTAITLKTSGPLQGTTIEIIAANLQASKLQDICRAWLDGDDASHWGEFEKGLDELITKHGRFE